MLYWKLIKRHELEALAAKASSKEEIVEGLYASTDAPREWTPFVILRDLANEGTAISLEASADWVLNETIDLILKSVTLPESLVDEFTRSLKRTLQKGLAALARDYARVHISALLENIDVPISKRIRAGSAEHGELSESEAEMVTRLLGRLEAAMQKDSPTDADIFKAFLRNTMLDYIPDNTPEYISYRVKLSASKRMHAELQVLRMLLNTCLSS